MKIQAKAHVHKKSATYDGDRILEIRKVHYDQLWHIVYETINGDVTYDRVTKQQALKHIP